MAPSRMSLGALVRHAHVRRIVLAVIVSMVVLATRCRWDELTEGHVPYVDYDTPIG